MCGSGLGSRPGAPPLEEVDVAKLPCLEPASPKAGAAAADPGPDPADATLRSDDASDLGVRPVPEASGACAVPKGA